MDSTELGIRREMAEQCRWLIANGFNQGTSGNISVRLGANQILITPSGIDYDQLQPEMMALMPIDGEEGQWEGEFRPSSESPFHRDIMKARPEINAIVHTHSTYATILSVGHQEIPACHYLIATLGGPIRCAPYARFGTRELSQLAVEALLGRSACLLGNHGAIALGTTLQQAINNAVQLEVLARQYYSAKTLGHVRLLTGQEVQEVRLAMEELKYGHESNRGNGSVEHS